MQSYLQLVSQGSFTGLALSDLYNQLNVAAGSNDVLLTAYLNSAVNFCERYTKLDLRPTTWNLVCDMFPFPPAWTWRDYGFYPYYIPNYPQYGLGRNIQLTQAIRLKRGPLSAIGQITYYDPTNTLTTLSSSTYTTTAPSYFPGTVEPQTYWPATYPRADAVTVTFTNAMSVIPECILDAIRLLVSERWNNREAIEYGPGTASGQTGKAVCWLLDAFTSQGVR